MSTGCRLSRAISRARSNLASHRICATAVPAPAANASVSATATAARRDALCARTSELEPQPELRLEGRRPQRAVQQIVAVGVLDLTEGRRWRLRDERPVLQHGAGPVDHVRGADLD